MQPGTATAPISKRRLRAGEILSGIAVLFLLFDSVIKVMVIAPLTSILGAILLTGYLGGAVATHVRIGSPLFTHILFPIYIAALLWGGLFLRDDRVRTLLTPRT